MYKKSYKTAELRNNPFNADVRVLFTDKSAEFLHLKLEPGKILAKVRIDIPAYFYVLEGNPEIIIDDKIQVIEKDEFVYCPAGSEHCINNRSSDTARILIAKTFISNCNK
ncbi:MAG: cupin domain-containing protein [Bacteroidales bacterium]|nr:cupin domain-containing protein [Bacteroidales bacterium]MDD4218392.1 cupin domain-containing protein [Bacteroidales bacterium]MDY0143788.1 cupin domain-containing protein [Bacteroidales bacterium]